MEIRIRRLARWRWRVLFAQDTWRIDWRTPARLPLQIVVTLRRWL